MESDKGIKIDGEGYLLNSDLNKRFPVTFEVEQIQTGKISGKCTLSVFGEEDFLTQSQLRDCRIIEGGMVKLNVDKRDGYILENYRDCCFKGESKNREEVFIKHIWVNGIHTLGEKVELKFSAEELVVSYDMISPEDQLCIEYGIINIDLRRLTLGYIETGIGKITLSKFEDHEEVREKMKIFKTPLLSGFINIKAANIDQFDSLESYFKAVNETVEKIIELLSLAQSTYLSYCRIRICSKPKDSSDQDEFKTKKLILLDLKTKAPNLGYPLIRDWRDIYKFISTTLPKYTDVQKKCDFNIALEWYLDSLISGVLQSKYLLACTCLELLKDRYNKMIDNEYILPKKLFDKKGYKYLKNNTSEMLKIIGINEGSPEHENIKKEIDENLISINRTSFKNSLLRLLEDYYIIYNDLFPYSFSWDNIPGNDSEKLISWLMADYDISWTESAKICKSDDGKTIRIFKDKNSAEIMIDKKKEKATLKISDGRTRNIEIKKENDKLNLYFFPNIKVIPKIRNQIIHSGTQEIDPKELFDVHTRLICLIQRIFLALLEYDGYFLDQNDSYVRKKFTDFIRGGPRALNAEEILRGEDGAR